MKEKHQLEYSEIEEKISILYLDEDIVVLSKPSGLLYHRSPISRDKIFFLQSVRNLTGNHVFPIHRLDRATSGVTVMARNSEAAHSLSEDLLQDNFTKHYLALVHEVPWESGTIDLPLTNHETREPMDCLTHFKRLAIGDNCALMELTPKTGRRHQLRRHMKKIHHYIVGDTTYGRKSINNIYRSNYEIQRLCLHAWSLSFPHPKTKKIVKFEAPLPEELQSAFRQIPGIAEIINLYC